MALIYRDIGEVITVQLVGAKQNELQFIFVVLYPTMIILMSLDFLN